MICWLVSFTPGQLFSVFQLAAWHPLVNCACGGWWFGGSVVGSCAHRGFAVRLCIVSGERPPALGDSRMGLHAYLV